VQTHRCPATVSGTKSAETTEVLRLGKVQRVGTCREPGDLPYTALRRPFEGKGRQRVCADPDRSRLGFFLRAASRAMWNSSPSLPGGGRGGEGEASRGSSRSVASLYPWEKVLTQVGALCKQRPPWNKTLNPFLGLLGNLTMSH
jgi:hypothetical protein